MPPSGKHLDCRNYAPLDAAKGLCHFQKKLCLADEPACQGFEKMPKCKHCSHYVQGREAFLGLCAASKGRPMAYPELHAVTCEWFSWRKEPRYPGLRRLTSYFRLPKSWRAAGTLKKWRIWKKG